METKLFTPEGGSADLKKYLPVNVNTTFTTLAPHLGLAEQKYIIPLLGKKLYNTLVSFDGETSGSGSGSNSASDSISGSGSGSGSNSPYSIELMAELKEEIKFAVLHLAYYVGYPVLSISLSDSGAKANVDTDKRLFRRQEEKLERYFLIEGLNKLDVCLQIIYENIDSFADFKESDFYIESSNSLIKDTKTFNQIYNINNSRLVFLKMRYYINMAENIDLKRKIGVVFFDELTKADLTKDKYKVIINDIRAYVVHLSIAKGIRELKKVPTEKGLIFETSNDDGYGTFPVDSNEMKQTIDFSQTLADDYLSNVIKYLKEHKTDYPNFIEYAGEDATQRNTIHTDNSNKNTFFFPIS